MLLKPATRPIIAFASTPVAPTIRRAPFAFVEDVGADELNVALLLPLELALVLGNDSSDELGILSPETSVDEEKSEPVGTTPDSVVVLTTPLVVIVCKVDPDPEATEQANGAESGSEDVRDAIGEPAMPDIPSSLYGQ
ncbi:hypothetical protein EW145_g3949 [Phellinidium pouzarii]|uniref:Uncharacterized protein n=1 Tax=Phellinidium pouzarii TaxID=167371 RepID=A0A4S4LAH7_9AGAM|nr:hypothetical protein EW145_g3949 [Phellinidium pouzarii]